MRISGWGEELDGLQQSLTGGFLVGVPLIYTMETWWIGESVSMPHALLFVAMAYVINLGFVAFTGFHRQEAGSRRPFGDALEATAVAIVATSVLRLLVHSFSVLTSRQPRKSRCWRPKCQPCSYRR